MSMQVSGRCIKVLPAETGMGKKGQWTKVTFVIETSGQYPKQIALTTWKADQMPAVGDDLTCYVELESREYNGRYYTDARAWKIEGFTGNMKAAQERKLKPNDITNRETIPDSAFESGASSNMDELPF